MDRRIPFRRALFFEALIGAVLVGAVVPAYGQERGSGDRPTQIYDTEIENSIRAFAKPVLVAAGIDPQAVHIHIVNSYVPNSFVSRGQRIFVTTGLLRTATNASQVIGVLAHETGHIAGGHLARLDAELKDASTPSIISLLAAAALGAASGNAGMAMAGLAAGQHVINRKLLAFTRVQERSADRAALYYLDQTHQSARGLLEFLQILDDQQALYASRQEQQAFRYDVTHPLTPDRIAYVREHVAHSKYSDVPVKPELTAMFHRIVAKLDGFLDPPSRTLAKYSADDRSIPARYARAIAYYRIPDTDKAMEILSGLIKESPHDPYFLELAGQILFESGRLEEALPYAQRSVKELPDAPLLRIALAHVEIELNRPELMKAAIGNLEKAIQEDDATIPLAWRLAATAYGRTGRLGQSALASAEYSYRIGRLADARMMAERAKRHFKEGEPGRLRAQDLLETLKRSEQD